MKYIILFSLLATIAFGQIINGTEVLYLYNATDKVTAVATGDSVQTWTSYESIEATSSNDVSRRPLYDGDITFHSAAELLTAQVASLGTTSFSIHIMVKSNYSSAGSEIIFWNTGNVIGWGLRQMATTNLARLKIDDGSNDFTRSSGAAINTNANIVISFVVTGRTSVNCYLDGVLSNGATSGTLASVGSITNTDDIVLGSSGGAGYWGGSAADFVCAKIDIGADAPDYILDLATLWLAGTFTDSAEDDHGYKKYNKWGGYNK